eukprot:NODE_8392_length_290_cov_4.539419_g7652_i0.p2 GENE.NODE_8392_length_290_cov_4.539419_g7652_i0~~NODE_8392_length_290_cov_4.539419_g7652_i0.p2  ORF type:complete len:59 (-),score=5.08 NODE_8392_length_290_cov_4.539419_g7652_i0:3-179(-)
MQLKAAAPFLFWLSRIPPPHLEVSQLGCHINSYPIAVCHGCIRFTTTTTIVGSPCTLR